MTALDEYRRARDNGPWAHETTEHWADMAVSELLADCGNLRLTIEGLNNSQAHHIDRADKAESDLRWRTEQRDELIKMLTLITKLYELTASDAAALQRVAFEYYEHMDDCQGPQNEPFHVWLGRQTNSGRA